MGSNLIDMTGMVFGDLKVVRREPRGPLDHGSAHWLCECKCGNTVVVRRDKLLGGREHCGCKTVRPIKPPPIMKEPGRRGRPPKERTVEEPKPEKPKEEKPRVYKPRPRPFTIPNPKAGRTYGFTETSKCKRCTKVFERPTGPWGWTMNGDIYCTYHCMREQEKEDLENKRKRGGKYAEQYGAW